MFFWQSAQRFAPVAGSYASIIFAIGSSAPGVLAVPVLAASGAAGMAGLLQKDWGFDRSIRKAPVFYGILLAGIILGTVLSIVSSNPIQLLVLSASVNGIAARPFLIVVMLISRDRAIMGEHNNGRLASTMGWIVTIVMCIAGQRAEQSAVAERRSPNGVDEQVLRLLIQYRAGGSTPHSSPQAGRDPSSAANRRRT